MSDTLLPLVDTYTFAVSEFVSGNRLLVTVFAHIGRDVHLVMTLYNDASMHEGQTLVDVHLLSEITERLEIHEA